MVISKKGKPLQRSPNDRSRRAKCHSLLYVVLVVIYMSAKCRNQIKSGRDETENDTGGRRTIFPFLYKPNILMPCLVARNWGSELELEPQFRILAFGLRSEFGSGIGDQFRANSAATIL